MTTCLHTYPLWRTVPLPEGWQPARTGNRREAVAAGRLTRRNMADYWRARGMRFSLSVFLSHWPEQRSLLWRPEGRSIRGVLSWTLDGTHAHLCELQLDEQRQGHGIGTTILVHWLQECHRQGVTRVDLKVFRDNPAYHLYTRCGFWAMAVDPHIPGFMTMRCTLDAQHVKRLQRLRQLLHVPSSLSA